jgi:hypothetical protein
MFFLIDVMKSVGSCIITDIHDEGDGYEPIHPSCVSFGFGGTHTSDYGVFQSVIVHFPWNLIDNTVS